jgi:Leucine-rich repeat (LRR) protein
MSIAALPERGSQADEEWSSIDGDTRPRWENYRRKWFEEKRKHVIWKNTQYRNWLNKGSPINDKVTKLELDGRNEAADVTDLTEQIINLPNLTTIKIIDSGLEALPNNIGQLTNLKLIDITYCDLGSLPESIGQLTNLLYLNLSETALESLPPNIGQLSSLYYLNVSFTPITALPPSIGQLNNLDLLILNNTAIEILPEELKNITEHSVCVFINETSFLTNHQQELIQWPRNFHFEYTFISRPRLPPLKSIKATIDTSAQARDVIMAEDDTVSNFLENKYKIFMDNVNDKLFYYAVNKETLLSQITQAPNTYFMCTKVGHQITDPHPLMSTKLITGNHGFLYREHFLNAVNSSNNYFMLEEKNQNKNIEVKRQSAFACEDSEASLYDIKIIDESFSTSSSSSSSSEEEGNFKRIKSNNEENNFGGGRKRKARKTRKTRNARNTRKAKSMKRRK